MYGYYQFHGKSNWELTNVSSVLICDLSNDQILTIVQEGLALVEQQKMQEATVAEMLGDLLGMDGIDKRVSEIINADPRDRLPEIWHAAMAEAERRGIAAIQKVTRPVGTEINPESPVLTAEHIKEYLTMKGVPIPSDFRFNVSEHFGCCDPEIVSKDICIVIASKPKKKE